MSIVPATNIGKVEFYEAHVPTWTTNAALIGLTTDQVADLNTLVTQARDDYEAMLVARNSAKSATQTFYNSVAAMHAGAGAGADMIQTIKTFAATSNNLNVFALADLPEPAAPGTTPPPGTPTDFKVSLRGDGALELAWKCSNPGNGGQPVYEILRRFGAGAFAFAGNAHERSYIDDSIPEGAAPVTYQITAVRTTARGNPAQFLVNFGAAGASVTVQAKQEDAA